MGPMATAIAAGCLSAMRWLLWLTTGLLLLLIVVQYFRGDVGAQPQSNALLALALFVLGALSGWIARRLMR